MLTCDIPMSRKNDAGLGAIPAITNPRRHCRYADALCMWWLCAFCTDLQEAPRNEAEMRAFCEAVPDKPKMANLVEKGATPCLPTALLDEIGYKLCARPLTLLMAAMNAMKAALEDIKEGKSDTKTEKYGRRAQND